MATRKIDIRLLRRGELKTGSFFDGRFYCRGVICFPDCWGYVPDQPKDVGP